MEKLGKILETSLKRLDQSDQVVEYGVWPIWDEMVGSTIARNAQPEKIRHGTLFVKVSSPTWMQQLQYMKEMISEKLNQSLGREVVKNIFFFVGKIETEGARSEDKDVRTPNHSVSKSKLNEQPLNTIKDPQIRRAFKRLFAAHSRKGMT
ncbi:MAG: DciA family protein [Candidatus Binatia bacterium]